MSSPLVPLISRISRDQELLQSVEEAVRQGAVLPVLAKLGWNTYDIREVVPEYSVGSGRVDYCLRVGERRLVFVEVKRVNQDLDRHEQQLLQYAFTEGVELAALTNGVLWWLYLPLTGGSWAQRRFLAIDLLQQEPEFAASQFTEYLSRANVADGSAARRARIIHDGKQKQELIEQTIPKAWQQILAGPDEALLELISDRVESMSGHRPDDEQVVRYLQGRFPQETPARYTPKTKAVFPASTPAKVEKPLCEPSPQRPDQYGSGERNIRISIDGTIIAADSVPDLYRQVLQLLVKNGFLAGLDGSLPFATSKQRYLLARQPLHPKGNPFVRPIEYNGYYMEAHKSHDNALQSLRALFDAYGRAFEVLSQRGVEQQFPTTPQVRDDDLAGKLPQSLADVLDVFRAVTEDGLSYNRAAETITRRRGLASVHTIYDSCTRKLGINTEQFRQMLDNPEAMRAHLNQSYPQFGSEIDILLGEK